jgi:hypothetical protein
VPPTAELLGAAVALLGLGFLTLCSVRRITRRRHLDVECPRPSGSGEPAFEVR